MVGFLRVVSWVVESFRSRREHTHTVCRLEEVASLEQCTPKCHIWVDVYSPADGPALRVMIVYSGLSVVSGLDVRRVRGLGYVLVGFVEFALMYIPQGIE